MNQFTTADLLRVIGLAGLTILLIVTRLAHSDTMKNIGQFGNDQEGKLLFASKTLFNFYMVVAATLVMIAGLFGLFSGEVFLVFFTAILAALGVKLGLDLNKSGNLKNKSDA